MACDSNPDNDTDQQKRKSKQQWMQNQYLASGTRISAGIHERTRAVSVAGCRRDDQRRPAVLRRESAGKTRANRSAQ
jgi:hypothetical protein